MEILHLLIVEDEDVQLLTYTDAINQFNKKNSTVQIEHKICKTFNDGRQALLSPHYDAAIIDLKLSGNAILEGRELVDAVYKKIRIPIFIVSGSIEQIDDIEENALLRKRSRDEKISIVLTEMVAIFNTGITSYLRPNGTIDKKLTQIFWDNLSKDINNWIEHNNKNSLLRYILSYFQESLEITLEGNFEEYHPAEVYLAPPIKMNFHTGDLLKIKDALFIILTPACDIVINYKTDKKGAKIASRKSDKMVLAQVKEFDFESYDNGKIKEFVTNNSYRYHYLPPFHNESGYLIDFQELSTKEYDPSHERIAAISSPFIKDIISRFSNYYSRQGQPTYKQQEIVDMLYKKKAAILSDKKDV